MPTFSSIRSLLPDGSSLASGGGFCAQPCANIGGEVESVIRTTAAKSHTVVARWIMRRGRMRSIRILFRSIPINFISASPEFPSPTIASLLHQSEFERLRLFHRPIHSHSASCLLLHADVSSPEADDPPSGSAACCLRVARPLTAQAEAEVRAAASDARRQAPMVIPKNVVLDCRAC